MIPTKLAIKNFICYRDNVPPINFEGIHVACLCGDNGSGKSSIFDAIAWALWGEASRGKSNDDLIFTGQNEMEVELEFRAGDSLYRVVRKQTRSTSSRPGQSLLELQVSDGGNFKSISEHTKTQTQYKIQELLHLDYQTFINSAMILQGRANEFSNKRPGERKEILANILDLSFYDQLEQQAKMHADQLKSESTVLERDIQRLGSSLDARGRLEEADHAIMVELERIENTRKGIEGYIASHRQKKEALSIQKESLDLLIRQLEDKKAERQSWIKRLSDSTSLVERFNKIMTSANDIEKGYAHYQDTVAEEVTQNEKLKKSYELGNRRKDLERFIASAQNAYGSERKLLSSQVAELTAKINCLPQLHVQLSASLKRQTSMQKIGEDLEIERQVINDIRASISKMSALNSELNTAIDEINRKLGLISEAGATCPLCETELGPDGQAKISLKLSTELEQKVAQSNDNASAIAKYRTELASREKAIKEKEASLQSQLDAVKRDIAVIEREIQQVKAAAEQLPAKSAALQKLENDLKTNNYAVEEQKALSDIIKEQDSLNYDAGAHKLVNERKCSLQKFEQAYRGLADARLQLEPQQKLKADAEATIKRLEIEVNELENKRITTERIVFDLPQIVRQLGEFERQHVTLLIEERNIRDRLAESRENLKRLDSIEVEKQEKQMLFQKLNEEESIYTELARDFGKKGIQALIIAEALPEIEIEANLLLNKMTDNRMSLSLDTQRDTRKGDVIETLDIKISDELGTRPYGMYSGGEAFRIDMALRIAISRLLVRRAGASMPILIIDEGFGTQDDSGLEKLVEAINSIKDDFEKVFVITHLEELKDRFPVLINIEKTSEGSKISMSG